jgi:hypothetical protein
LNPQHQGDHNFYQRPPDGGGIGAAFLVVLFIMGLTTSVFALSFGWISIDIVNRSVNSKGTPITATKPVKALAVLDWDIQDGHFYTQTNGKEQGSSAEGYSVTNKNGIPFWDEFQRQGSVVVIGFPLTSRFEWRGMTTQIFQRAVMQYNPDSKQVDFINIMDELHMACKDDWLKKEYQVPESVPDDFDVGRTWEQARDNRMLFIGKSQAMKDKYMSVPDPLKIYGLPSSAIEDEVDHKAIRLQRGVLRQWTQDKPGAQTGEVTAANAGEMILAAGMITSATTQTEQGTPPSEASKMSGFGGIIVAPTMTTVQPQAPVFGIPATPVPAAATNAKTVKIVNTNGDGVFIRKTPHLNDKLVPWPDNTVLKVVGPTVDSEGIKWYYVEDPRNNRGYIPAQYVTEQ